MAIPEHPDSALLDGFIAVDSMLEDWEIVALGFGPVHRTAQEAKDFILTEIHPAYWESYGVRELSAGRLIPSNPEA